MFRLGSVLIALLTVACTSSGGPTEPAPVKLGVVRLVDAPRLEDPDEWGPELDLAIETEFWDLIGNSDHARYPAWHDKAKRYVENNPEADPRLDMLIAAGAVFSLTTLFQSSDALSQIGEYGDYIEEATVGIREAIEPLRDYEPALVFFHNNRAMLAFLLTADADLGVCHLEKLRNLEDANPDFHGTEGRAAAPFTYGIVNDEAYVDYAIEMMEGCETWICNWTSKLAPFKPIGQLMTLAELHAIKASMSSDPTVKEAALDQMNALLDRAVMLGSERGYAFIERIEALRDVLPGRGYTNGIGMGRAPMPVYSNETNCSNCHIGAIPGAFGQDLSDPYPGAEKWTAKPAPPSFLGTDTVDCD